MIIWPFCAFFYIISTLVLLKNTVCYINLTMFQVNGAVKYIFSGFILQLISYLIIAYVWTKSSFYTSVV